ncbi:MAG: CDP-alcohol phosphatidyltransferase [Bacteroidetes bacterium]|nr:MAG: CDP-alcohol phosphatidyltransferase [Bacteroidota bacterium]
MKQKSLRSRLQKGIYAVINPFVKLLIRMGLTPNMVTTIGLVLNIGVAVIFIMGGEEGNRGDLSYIGWAGLLVLIAGLFDMLDGQVARLGNMSSAFGALYDSVLDRYSELVMFLGICYYLVAHHYFMSSIIAFIALIGSMMVSYTRARAEGLGIESKGGLMQRPERVVTVGIAAIACGVTSHFIGGNYKLFVKGIPFHIFETMSIFTIPLTILAVLTNITAINRLRDAKKAIEQKEKMYPVKKENSKVNVFSWILIVAITAFGFSTPSHDNGHPASNISVADPADTFPIPQGIKNQLFYVQRTHNSNTVICELNLRPDGKPDDENPVHVFWIRYTEQGQHAELSFIQRVFAYGVKARPIGNDNFELRFVSFKKRAMYLIKSPADNKYHVYTSISQKSAILSRIFIKINGGSFWSPNVEYIEVKGTDPSSGRELKERIKV